MRTFISCLVLATISLDLACGLQCYVCEEKADMRNCGTQGTCQEGQKACTLSVYTRQSDGMNVTKRGCAENCLKNDPQLRGLPHFTFCCNAGLCNTNENVVAYSASGSLNSGSGSAGSWASSGSSGTNTNHVSNTGSSGGSSNVVYNPGMSGSSGGSSNVIYNPGMSGSSGASSGGSSNVIYKPGPSWPSGGSSNVIYKPGPSGPSGGSSNVIYKPGPSGPSGGSSNGVPNPPGSFFYNNFLKIPSGNSGVKKPQP